jgi:hypothetical protein
MKDEWLSGGELSASLRIHPGSTKPVILSDSEGS